MHKCSSHLISSFPSTPVGNILSLRLAPGGGATWRRFHFYVRVLDHLRLEEDFNRNKNQKKKEKLYENLNLLLTQNIPIYTNLIRLINFLQLKKKEMKTTFRLFCVFYLYNFKRFFKIILHRGYYYNHN